MKCPKCGNECEKGSNFCSSCGAKLVRTCTKCGRVLKKDEKFCPECGTSCGEKNEKPAEETVKETVKKPSSIGGILGFALVVIVAGFCLYSLLSSSFVSFNRVVIRNGVVVQRISYQYVKLAEEILLGLIIALSVVFRITKARGWGIAASILSAVACLIWFRSPAPFLMLIGTIVSYTDRK